MGVWLGKAAFKCRRDMHEFWHVPWRLLWVVYVRGSLIYMYTFYWTCVGFQAKNSTLPCGNNDGLWFEVELFSSSIIFHNIRKIEHTMRQLHGTKYHDFRKFHKNYFKRQACQILWIKHINIYVINMIMITNNMIYT